MFTGIVEELGEVVGIEVTGGAARLTVRGPLVTGDATRGDSIAINGVCLTVTDMAGGAFSADVMGETLDRSSLGALTPGTAVNLERPMRPDGRLGGHIVQGHVDGTGTILARQPDRLGGGADLGAARAVPLRGGKGLGGRRRRQPDGVGRLDAERTGSR